MISGSKMTIEMDGDKGIGAEFKTADALPEDETIATPTITSSSGTTFDADLQVTIRNNTSDGRIYYALGNGKFTAGETPFTISGTTTVKAIAVKDGKKSHEAVETFTKNQYILTVYNGTDNGRYDYGATPTITANTPPRARYLKNGQALIIMWFLVMHWLMKRLY